MENIEYSKLKKLKENLDEYKEIISQEEKLTNEIDYLERRLIKPTKKVYEEKEYHRLSDDVLKNYIENKEYEIKKKKENNLFLKIVFKVILRMVIPLLIWGTILYFLVNNVFIVNGEYNMVNYAMTYCMISVVLIVYLFIVIIKFRRVKLHLDYKSVYNRFSYIYLFVIIVSVVSVVIKFIDIKEILTSGAEKINFINYLLFALLSIVIIYPIIQLYFAINSVNFNNKFIEENTKIDEVELQIENFKLSDQYKNAQIKDNENISKMIKEKQLKEKEFEKQYLEELKNAEIYNEETIKEINNQKNNINNLIIKKEKVKNDILTEKCINDKYKNSEYIQEIIDLFEFNRATSIKEAINILIEEDKYKKMIEKFNKSLDDINGNMNDFKDKIIRDNQNFSKQVDNTFKEVNKNMKSIEEKIDKKIDEIKEKQGKIIDQVRSLDDDLSNIRSRID